MLYKLLKFPAIIAFRIICRDLRVNDPSCFQLRGPLLIACNHPNSFLDAVVFSILFKRPVISLARGDVFINKTVSRILRMLNILPVFRLSEGAGRLDENYGTFGRCRDIFSKNGIVLIFSEGLCVNEWHLRELKKGTARLAISAWEEGIPLKVLPAGINYQSFTSFGKNIILNFGKIFTAADLPVHEEYGKNILSFNRHLRSELSNLVIEADSGDKEKIHSIFHKPVSLLRRMVLFIPSVAGYLFHAPLYLPLRNFIRKKAGHTGHYDSIIVAALFLIYPFYLALSVFLLWLFTNSPWCLMIFALLPVAAACHIQLKKQF